MPDAMNKQFAKTVKEKEEFMKMGLKDSFKYLHGNKKKMMESILEDVFKEGRVPVGYLVVFAKPAWIDETKFDADENAEPDFTAIEYTMNTISKYSTETFSKYMEEALEKWANDAFGPGSEHKKTEFTAAAKF